MVAARKTEGPSDPVFREVLSRHVGQWAPVLVARAAYGLSSVLVVGVEPAGVGAVAVLSPAEASALLRARNETRGAARVVGTAAPGSAWAVGVSATGATVWSAALGPYLQAAG